MNKIEQTLTSLEVAEMVGREHNEVLKDVRRIIAQLGEGNLPQSYFIESTYKNSQNREMPSFLLTKKGCELYATRMTGEKGTQFAVAYIEKFNEMENHIESEGKTKLLLKAALEHEEKIETIRTDVNMLKNTMRIDGVQEHRINNKAKAVIVKTLNGKESQAYKNMSSKVFARFWRDFKNHFQVPRYGELPKVEYENAVEFIDYWQPDTTTRLEIRRYNNQQQFPIN